MYIGELLTDDPSLNAEVERMYHLQFQDTCPDCGGRLSWDCDGIETCDTCERVVAYPY